MKKKRIRGSSGSFVNLPKIYRTMKLICLFMFVALFQVSASSYAQSAKLNISGQNLTLEKVFELIEDQSEFSFIYNLKQIDLSKKVDVESKNQKVERILNEVLEGTDIAYTVNDRLIVVHRGGEASSLLSSVTQQKSITGKVTDAQREPLPGVTVIIKGTTSGTVTNFNGEFNLNNVTSESALVFSFVGMTTQELLVGNQTSVDITMLADAIGLEEVIAVGYGTMKRMDISGASARVSTTVFKDLPSTDIAQSMQGRVAGLAITSNSGSPGASSKIRIRGGNSMLGNNNPLIVLDGVAVNIGLNDINPNDIASLDILKDASSTAIYGSRGANGVIVITTKTGNSDIPRIQISTNYSLDQVANRYDMLNAADFVTLNDITLTGPSADTDWQDQVFQNGMTSNTQLSITGGNEKLKYFLSGSLVDQDGLVRNTGYQKYNLRSNIDTKINDKLNVSLNLSVSKTERNNTNDNAASKGSTIWQSLIWSPTEPVFNEDGSYNKTDQYSSIGLNPFMVATERQNDLFATALLANSKIDYKITDKLTYSAILGADEIKTERATFTNQFVSPTTGSSRSYNGNFFWQFTNFLTYKNTFNDVHRISVMAGFEQSQNTTKGFNANGSNLATETVGYHNLALNASAAIGSYWRQSSLRSYLGRATYSLRDKYLLTATFRMDGSSKFQDSNKYSSFPSLALGWRISEESFMQSADNIDNLKLRASWGITGSQAIAPYATLALLTPKAYSYGTPNLLTGYMPSGAPNPDLIWEETTQINIGADLSMFNGRLNVTADYFQKNTDGLLQAKALPAYNGGGSIISNIGEIENKGIELAIGGDIIRKSDFSWNAALNYSKLNNKVLSIGDEEQIFPGGNYASGFLSSKVFIVKPGESLGSLYGYNFLGIWQQEEASEALKYGNVPGDSKYEDLDGNYIIDGGDQKIIGKGLPDFNWGLNNSFSYKDFDLNIMIEGVHGRDVINLGYAGAGAAVGDARAITLEDAKNTWTESNTNTIWPKIGSTSNTDYINSSKWVQDGSYVKLRNISLAYSIPKEKLKIGDLRIVLSGQNLLTFTDYKGFDPEVSSTGKSDIDQGLDLGSYPTAKSYTIGLTLNF
ncbi:MAG: TonB-dependent receptor [Bacteroidetes bacterium]|nr:TonB-dependent receptor [Bacteroidota bacterium]